MSYKNRKRMYDYLVANNKLSQDDGALSKEFGNPEGMDISFADMTKDELKIQLRKNKLAFGYKDTKDQLIVKLETNSKMVPVLEKV